MFRAEYAGTTLRDHLGLAPPAARTRSSATPAVESTAG